MCGKLGRVPPLLILGLIILLGKEFRMYRLEEKSLWSDEIATIATGLGYSVDPEAYRMKGLRWDPPEPIPVGTYFQKAIAGHPEDLKSPTGWLRHWERTARVLRDNVHPPLFFGLMGLWMEVFGIGPAVLRLPAACFGILGIPLIYLLALRLSTLAQGIGATQRQRFALLSAAFFAFSAYQIDHAQDARPYTLLTLLAMAALLVALHLVQKQGKGWGGWFLLALILTAGLYTQYFFMLFAGWLLLMLALAPLAARWLGLASPPLKTFWIKLGLCVALIGLLWWPWLESFRAQMAFLKQAGHYTMGLWQPLRLPEKLWRILCEFFLPGSPAGKIVPLVILLSALGLEIASRRGLEGTDDPKWRCWFSPIPILLLWLLGLVGGQMGLDLLRGTHTATIRRYLLLAAPACYMLMAWLLSAIAFPRNGGGDFNPRFQKWYEISGRLMVAGILAGSILVLMLGDTVYRLTAAHTSSDEFRRAAQWINAHRQADDRLLVCRSGAMAVGMAYYLHPDMRMMGLEQKEIPATVLRKPGRIWMVFTHTSPRVRRRMETRLLETGYRNFWSRQFPGVRVYLWQQKIK